MANTPYPDDPTDILRDVLKLERVDADEHASTFVGHTPPQTGGRVFGGQVMAQSLVAASHSVDADRFLHSMHCYFIRPGDATQPLHITVDHHRDGRSFSVRHVEVTQHDKVILSLTCSFQTESGGVEHHEPMPEGIPHPDRLPPISALVGMIDDPAAQELAYNRPFDIRYAYEPMFLRPAAEKVNRNIVWMKTFTPVNVSPNVAAAGLAYASDYTILESVLRNHGVTWSQPDKSVASLDHAMWFHRPFNLDDWLLFVQESPSAQSARGLGIGHIYTIDGDLVATVAQEGMIRLPQYD
ncbi:acyl-CoA thioesterase [Enteractinococcus helveticum]|uniref:Acyl-CoA thioesterase II n=1 Tax=Enteractinococcus helveticum TaxID=1837282 RepID=A0A1B7LXP3_9MICC|nr:acyl-CoA thioesterase II [Enteractinococcus helveticum]OAV59942.1 acyl-CoA thioesterase II [Enteractinococcus helveticum]